MQIRHIGTQGLVVSALGLGTMGMSPGVYGAVSDDESVATIQRALDLGITMLDTANIYGDGHNERLVGRAFAGRREQVVVATKFGIVSGETEADGSLKVNGRPEYVRQQIDQSLQRLGTDVIDLYYYHRIDRTVPIEETVGAMAELVRVGKVRYIGLSEANAETIRGAHAVHPLTAVQTEYSLFSRDPETQVFPTLRELGIGFVAYMPLGAGFLTGRITTTAELAQDDFRRNLPRYQEDNLRQNLALAEQIKAIAAEKGITPAQLALAWVLAQGEFIVPIFGTRHIPNLESNVQAADIVLMAEDLTRIAAAVPPEAVAGARVPSFLEHVNQ